MIYSLTDTLMKVLRRLQKPILTEGLLKSFPFQASPNDRDMLNRLHTTIALLSHTLTLALFFCLPLTLQLTDTQY